MSIRLRRFEKTGQSASVPFFSDEFQTIAAAFRRSAGNNFGEGCPHGFFVGA